MDFQLEQCAYCNLYCVLGNLNRPRAIFSLFGITIRQAYQYYITASNDPIAQKLVVSLFSSSSILRVPHVFADWLGLVNVKFYQSSTAVLTPSGLLQFVGYVSSCILNVLGVFIHPRGNRLRSGRSKCIMVCFFFRSTISPLY